MPAISFTVRLEFIMTLYENVCVVSEYFWYFLTLIMIILSLYNIFNSHDQTQNLWYDDKWYSIRLPFWIYQSLLHLKVIVIKNLIIILYPILNFAIFHNIWNDPKGRRKKWRPTAKSMEWKVSGIEPRWWETEWKKTMTLVR